MSNSNLPAEHDTSLDDAKLVRRCERRVMMFPRYKQDFLLASADTTQSSTGPTSSVSVLDASGEGLSADSLQSSTMTLTDKHDSTVVANTSVNRNPYQDGRRWAGQGDWCYPTHHTHIHPETSSGTGVRNCHAGSGMLSEVSQHHCFFVPSDNEAGKHNEKTDVPSTNSSDSLPIIDNLILEPQTDLKTAVVIKARQYRNASRCTQHDPQRAIIYAWRETNSHSNENKKHKQQKTTPCRQPSSSRSYHAGKCTIDPGSEIYLKKLDNILQKMCMKTDKQNPRLCEKMTRTPNTKETVCSSVNKACKISPTRKVCMCSCKSSTSNKLSIHEVIDEMKRVGQFRSRQGPKLDITKQEKTLSAPRPITRTRCTQRSDKKQVIEGHQGSASTCKEQTRQHSLPTTTSQRSIGVQGNGKTRSKSLSALPRCHTHTLTPASSTHGGAGKAHSCGTAVSCCRCPDSLGLGKITKQQEEILKHIPKDITADEIGALMKTVLSIVERRHSLKDHVRDGDNQDGLQDGTDTGREDLSKYDVRGQTDSCNTHIILSSKPQTQYSHNTADDMSSNDLLQTTLSSQSSRDEGDVRSKHLDSDIDNKSTNFGSRKTTCLNAAAGLVSDTMKDDVRTSSLPLASLRCGGSTSSSSEYSSRTYVSKPGSSHKSQLSTKQSAVVLPFDDTNFPQENGPVKQRSDTNGSDQLVAPTASPAADRLTQEIPETKYNVVNSSVSADKTVTSRHIGWKYPLQTERRNAFTITDILQEGGNVMLPRAGDGNVVRSDSTLSDGLLYVKSHSAARTLTRHGLPHRSCASHEVLQGDRGVYCDDGVHQRDGRKSSSSSLINGTDAEAKSTLLPCPHEHNQGRCSQGDFLTNHHYHTALEDAELDRKITDLRLQIRSSYHTPVSRMLKTGASARCGASSSQTKHILERQGTFVKSPNQDAGRYHGDTTDLDALSCSVDTVLTNTSISNRLQELDGELSSSPGYEWRSSSSVIPAGQCTCLSGQCEFHRRHQYASYTTDDRVDKRDGGKLISDLTTDLLHHPSELFSQRGDLHASGCNYKLQKNRVTAETRRETSQTASEPAPQRLSTFSAPNMDVSHIQLRTQGLGTGTEQSFSNKTEKVRKQAENVWCRNESSMLQSCKYLNPESSLQTLGNLAAVDGMDTSRKLTRASSMQLPGRWAHRNSFGISNIMKPPTSIKQHGNLKPASSLQISNMTEFATSLEQPSSLKPHRKLETPNSVTFSYSAEQSGNWKPYTDFDPINNRDPASNWKPYTDFDPINNRDPASNWKPYTDFDPINNRDPASNWKPYTDFDPINNGDPASNWKPYTDFESINNRDPASNTDPLDNVNLYNNADPPTSMGLVTNLKKPKNLLSSVKSGQPSPLVSDEHGQTTDTPIVKRRHSAEVQSTSVAKSFRQTNLAQLKQQTESLLIEVCRRYCADTLVPNLGKAGSSHLLSAHEFLQNFSPISQVDVNTQYPVTVSAKEQVLSAKTTSYAQNSRSKSEVAVSVNQSNRPSKGSQHDKNTSSDTRAETFLLKKKLRRGKNISKTLVNVSKTPVNVSKTPVNVYKTPVNVYKTPVNVYKTPVNVYKTPVNVSKTPVNVSKTPVKDQDQFAVQRPNHNSTGRGFPEPKPQMELVNPCIHETTGNLRRQIKKKSAENRDDIVLVDVTSPHTNDECFNEPEDKTPNQVSSHSIIWKKYSPTSAMPVEVKELNCSVNDQSVVHSETAKKLSPTTQPVQCESYNNPRTSVRRCETPAQNSQGNTNACCQASQHGDSSPLCTIQRLASAAAVARKMLASNVTHSGRMFSLANSSFTSDSFLETTTDSDISLQEIKIEEARGWNCTNNNNSNNPTRPGTSLLGASVPETLFSSLFHTQHGTYPQMLHLLLLHPRRAQPFTSSGLQPKNWIDVLVNSLTETTDDNESAAASRPCAKILGELAFQLERRILDYVFGMEGFKRRRFYGYTVNNICQMMSKESKNVCGTDDPVRKSELAFRLKKLLIGLKRVGYDIKFHGDFAQQIVNTYGLLPCPPDPLTIHEFGLHNANCIASLINQLACNESEAGNLHTLLNSLKYLSKCDGRPLFVW